MITRTLHRITLALALAASPAVATPSGLLDPFKAYQQGASIALLAETRQALFKDTDQPEIRAGRERDLLAFISSDAHPQAKAIAIGWLGQLGSAAAVPALVTAAADPALASPAAMALEQISGPEAAAARHNLAAADRRMPAPAPAAAAAASFTAAVAADPAAADKHLAAALRSPVELLAGAALRQIRAGTGSPRLADALLESAADLPPHRRTALWHALAARPNAAETLRRHLLPAISSDQPDEQALLAIGPTLDAEDVPLLLKLAAAESSHSDAAQAALSRATDPAINPALVKTAATTGPPAVAAIKALAARRAVEASDDLAAIATAGRPDTAAAAWLALAVVMNPHRLGEITTQAVAADGTPNGAPLLKLSWELARRHPDPAAAAGILTNAAKQAPEELGMKLVQFAERIRPKDPAPKAQLELPDADDHALLAPNGSVEVIYLNCGTFPEAAAGAISIRRTAGEPFRFGTIAHPLATVDYGAEVAYEINGLPPGADYVLALSTWDADLGGRRQSLTVNGQVLIPSFAPIAWHADKPTYARLHVPLPRKVTDHGKLTITLKSLAGPNAVLSELRLLRRSAEAARSVVILTGDDYPAHRWRQTGPEFAAMLRADPSLEVTISESPWLIGSPALTRYDAVFLHFKNYAERTPLPVEAWRNLEAFVHGGRGLVIAHFGCGAAQEWNGFVKLAGRVWDPKLRAHDPYGEFLVRIVDPGHPATAGLTDFTTTDELYTCLAGTTEIHTLAEATSKVDQSVHPMAFVLTPGKGRVFHSSLGHDTRALEAPAVRQLYLQATLWATNQTQ